MKKKSSKTQRAKRSKTKKSQPKVVEGTTNLKRGFASMVKHGVIMDVTNARQAKIAEKAGAVAVMALERVPADIRVAGGVARMADPQKIKEIMKATSIPVMAKCRIGHFAEAQILEEIGVDMIDESEVLTPVDIKTHVDKAGFNTPFVCGARDLWEALRRISEGAAMIRTKGEPGTGDVAEALRHMKLINKEIEALRKMSEDEREEKSNQHRIPMKLILETRKLGRLPVVNFAAGGIATPADASLMMQLGADGIFVGSGIFKSANPLKRAKAIVEATNHYNEPKVLVDVSCGLGPAMKGILLGPVSRDVFMQERGV